jgi:hypothetical protein
LLSEVDTFLDSYALGDEVRNLELDVRLEVAEFATVFIEVVKRSRTPGDVLMSHPLGSLHKRIASIKEQLSRLLLVIPLQDYAKAVSVESLFSEFLFLVNFVSLYCFGLLSF